MKNYGYFCLKFHDDNNDLQLFNFASGFNEKAWKRWLQF